jgi:hypothetical protein
MDNFAMFIGYTVIGLLSFALSYMLFKNFMWALWRLIAEVRAAMYHDELYKPWMIPWAYCLFVMAYWEKFSGFGHHETITWEHCRWEAPTHPFSPGTMTFFDKEHKAPT